VEEKKKVADIGSYLLPLPSVLHSRCITIYFFYPSDDMGEEAHLEGRMSYGKSGKEGDA
jgi:hypothetical protein